MNNVKPTAWTIAGIDSSAKAGIYADLQTFADFDIEAQAITTLITAQNNQQIANIIFCEDPFVTEQINCLSQEKMPDAIKLGALGKSSSTKAILRFLKNYKGKVVFDPVLKSTSGHPLIDEKAYYDICKSLFSHIDLFTPNLIEASVLLETTIQTTDDMMAAANKFIEMGCSAVLLKGGHLKSKIAHDYFTDGKTSFWINATQIENGQMRGTGCVLSSAITACLANGFSLYDALVVAKMYLQNKIRCFANPIHSEDNLPWITDQPSALNNNFPSTGPYKIGLYPIIDSIEWLEYCLQHQATTLQLRIKNKPTHEIEQIIAKSVSLANQSKARLFINDYWQLAIKHGAYGVHLGQSDLNKADMKAIRQAGLRLGLSTHCYYEIARAHALKPSYIAYGPIYPTTSKIMPFSPRGIHRLKRWCQGLNYPMVAIGGINSENYNDVLATGVDGIAFISAIKDFFKDPGCQI